MNAHKHEWLAGIVALGLLVFGLWVTEQGYDAAAYDVLRDAVVVTIAAAATDQIK
jgi:hypothetical protein